MPDKTQRSVDTSIAFWREEVGDHDNGWHAEALSTRKESPISAWGCGKSATALREEDQCNPDV
jgi:hypothetical protein